MRRRPASTDPQACRRPCAFLLLGGSAYAATHLPKNSVGTRQLQKDAVTPRQAEQEGEGHIYVRADQPVDANPGAWFVQTTSASESAYTITPYMVCATVSR